MQGTSTCCSGVWSREKGKRGSTVESPAVLKADLEMLAIPEGEHMPAAEKILCAVRCDRLSLLKVVGLASTSSPVQL